MLTGKYGILGYKIELILKHHQYKHGHVENRHKEVNDGRTKYDRFRRDFHALA